MRTLIIIWTLLLFASCAKKPAEEVDEAIDVALSYLTDEKCDKAIKVLEDVGRDYQNPIYIQVLASAYACRAEYNEVKFLDTEIPKIVGTQAGLLKSLTQLNLSAEHQADSDEYLDLQEALNILFYTDTQAEREALYGPRKAGDIGVQALFLSLNQLGKFIHYYGNVSAAGLKGLGAANVDEQGASLSKCFVEYTDSRSLTAIGLGSGGVCNNANLRGHPDLKFIGTDLAQTKIRMCQGLMLVTNIMDILNNIDLPDDPSMGSLSNVTAVVNDLKTLVTAADPSLLTLLETTSQASCETLVAGPAEFNNLQLIYTLLFEANLP